MDDDQGRNPDDIIDSYDLPAKEIHLAMPGGAEPDDDLLDHAVDEINRTVALAGLASVTAISECVIRVFANGSRKHFKDGRRRHASFGALRGRAETLALSPSTLSRYVGVYYQYEKFPKEINDALPLTSQILLLTVKDDATRVALAQKAVLMGLTKQQLRAEIVAAQPRKTGPGRKPVPAATKALNALKKAATDLDAADITEVDPDSADAHVADIDGLLDLLGRTRAALAAVLPDEV